MSGKRTRKTGPGTKPFNAQQLLGIFILLEKCVKEAGEFRAADFKVLDDFPCPTSDLRTRISLLLDDSGVHEVLDENMTKIPGLSTKGYTGRCRKGKKRKREPAYPHIKGVPNPYMLYSMALREKVKKDNPGLIGKEINKKLGDLWNKGSDKSGNRMHAVRLHAHMTEAKYKKWKDGKRSLRHFGL